MEVRACGSEGGVMVLVVASDTTGLRRDVEDFVRAMRARTPVENPLEVLSAPPQRLAPPGRRRTRPTAVEGRLRSWRVEMRGR